MKKYAILAILLLCVSIIFGCANDTNNTETMNTESTNADSSTESETQSTESASSSVEPKAEGEDWTKKFVDFTKNKLSNKYTIKYKMTTPQEGMEKLTATQYFESKKKMRMDMKIQGMEVRTYVMGDTFYSCNKADSWTCMKFTSDEEYENMDLNANFDDIDAMPQNYDISYAGTKQVAGKTAVCFTVDHPEAELEECFSKEGIPLYIKVGFDGEESVMEALEFSSSIPAGTFDLPAEPTDMNAMLENMGDMQNMDEEDMDALREQMQAMGGME